MGREHASRWPIWSALSRSGKATRRRGRAECNALSHLPSSTSSSSALLPAERRKIAVAEGGGGGYSRNRTRAKRRRKISDLITSIPRRQRSITNVPRRYTLSCGGLNCGRCAHTHLPSSLSLSLSASPSSSFLLLLLLLLLLSSFPSPFYSRGHSLSGAITSNFSLVFPIPGSARASSSLPPGKNSPGLSFAGQVFADAREMRLFSRAHARASRFVICTGSERASELFLWDSLRARGVEANETSFFVKLWFVKEVFPARFFRMPGIF